MDGNDGDNNCENIEKCEIKRKIFFKNKNRENPSKVSQVFQTFTYRFNILILYKRAYTS